METYFKTVSRVSLLHCKHCDHPEQAHDGIGCLIKRGGAGSNDGHFCICRQKLDDPTSVEFAAMRIERKARGDRDALR